MQDLPLVETDEPLLGFKYAELRGRRSPRMYPSGRFWRRPYEHRHAARAECHRRRHPAPALDCSCGFHAVQAVTDLPEVTDHHARHVVLRVEFSGTVVEHERGLRGEQQTVLGVLFPGACARCGAPANRVLRDRVWASVCPECAARMGRRALTRADAASLLGVDVDFAPVAAHRPPRRVVPLLREVAVIAGSIALAWTTLRAGGGSRLQSVAVGQAAMVVTLGLGWGQLTLPRSRELLFRGQCGVIVAASLGMALAS